MRIRIATKAWNDSRAATGPDDTKVGIGTEWVELDGHRTRDVIDAKVETGPGGTVVTLRIAAAAEMVLLDGDGQVIR